MPTSMGLRRVCVYCGSSPGTDPAYADAVSELARSLVARGTGIVYGGGAVGLMGVLADAALEELVEVYTWSQLGIHAKPVSLLDVGGYWAPLAAWLDHAVDARFLRTEHRATLLVDDDPVRLLDRLAAWRPAGTVEKWIDRDAR